MVHGVQTHAKTITSGARLVDVILGSCYPGVRGQVVARLDRDGLPCLPTTICRDDRHHHRPGADLHDRVAAPDLLRRVGVPDRLLHRSLLGSLLVGGDGFFDVAHQLSSNSLLDGERLLVIEDAAVLITVIMIIILVRVGRREIDALLDHDLLLLHLLRPQVFARHVGEIRLGRTRELQDGVSAFVLLERNLEPATMDPHAVGRIAQLHAQ